MKLNGREYGRTELARWAGDLSAAGGVRSVVLDDGSERGIRALEFKTAAGLRFEVLVDRAMDIGAAEFRGTNFAWRSATGLRHPGLHEYNDENGLAWLRSFSGLLVSAGLDHILLGLEVDAKEYHYPYRQSVTHGLHGRLANTPARLIGYGEEWHGERCVLWAEGEVRQAAIFGEHLRLRRRIEAELDGAEFRLTDVVTNAGFDSTPHMLLYHINIGWPLLDEGARFDAPIDSTLWSSESVAAQRVSHLTFPRPQSGFVEQVYEHRLKADSERKVRARVTNPRLPMFFEFEYDERQFPAFFQWLHLRDGAYAMAFEPSTNHVTGEAGARADGTLRWLDAGSSHKYESVFRVGDSAEE